MKLWYFFKTLLLVLACYLSLGLGIAQDIEPELLSREILTRTSRVDSFEFIATVTQKLGVRAYLFGGSAAAYAHYVHWDLMREAGDPRFHADRFTYAYVDIFRSNQDMDIVIDGTKEQAVELQKLLSEKFPFFQGNKPVWEIRLLRSDIDDKQALLNNPDFLNQHTDSNSTALIELSTNPREAQILDLRDWNNPKHCQFLLDVQAQKLHYYFSELHTTTSRYEQGMNPSILSVIRYLTKAFQYELAIDAETKILLKQIIADFNYQDIENKYVKKWLNNNGKKLYENAVNLEYASKVLDEFGLKTKLKVIGDINNPQDLAWWMNKEPLPSKPIGLGHGKTARELGITTVAHETNSFSAWESIIKSHENVPNVFISRSGGNGENAFYGNGFYTQIGEKGARGTGITIRFKIHPLAREGSDFEIHKDNYIVVKNKNVLEIVHEDLSWTPMEYFDKLINGFTFDSSDKASQYKLKQKITKNIIGLSEVELSELHQRLNQYFDNPNPKTDVLIYSEWLSLKLPQKYLPTPGQLEKASQEALQYIVRTQNIEKELLKTIIKKADSTTLTSLGKYTFSQPDTHHLSDLLKLMIQKADPNTLESLAQYTFSQPHTQNMQDNLKLMIEKAIPSTLQHLVKYTFSQPHTQHMTDLLKLVIEKAHTAVLTYLAKYVFSQPHTQHMTDLLKLVIEKADVVTLHCLAEYTFSQPHTQHMQDLLKLVIEKADPATFKSLAEYTFSQPHTQNMQDLLKLVIQKADMNTINLLTASTFSQPHTQHMQEALKLLIERGDSHTLFYLAAYTFSQPHTQNMTDLLKIVMEKADSSTLHILETYTFSQPHAQAMHELQAIMHGLKNLPEEKWTEYVSIELKKLSAIKPAPPNCLRQQLLTSIDPE